MNDCFNDRLFKFPTSLRLNTLLPLIFGMKPDWARHERKLISHLIHQRTSGNSGKFISSESQMKTCNLGPRVLACVAAPRAKSDRFEAYRDGTFLLPIHCHGCTRPTLHSETYQPWVFGGKGPLNFHWFPCMFMCAHERLRERQMGERAYVCMLDIINWMVLRVRWG